MREGDFHLVSMYLTTCLYLCCRHVFLQALQAASICTGLPYTVLLCLLMPAIWRGLAMDNPSAKDANKHFLTPVYGGIFDIMEWIWSLGATDFPLEASKAFVLNALFPFFAIYKILSSNKFQENSDSSSFVFAAAITSLSFLCFIAWIILLAAGNYENSIWAIGWVMYISFAFIVADMRHRIRKMRGINGNFVEDIAAAVFVYPNVLFQCTEALNNVQTQALTSRNVEAQKVQ